VGAATVNQALAVYDALEAEADHALHRFRPRLGERGRSALWIEVCGQSDEADAGEPRELRQRRDGLMNRSLWQFTDRTEARYDFVAPLHGEETP
jgi:hypothetical protein